MIEYPCINARKSIGQKLRHCHRAKTWWTWHTISIIAKNKLHTHHKTHVHTIKVYKTRPVYSLTIKVFTEVFICSKVINAFKQQNSQTDPFWKSSTSFASIFRKLSSQNIAWWCDMSRFLSPVSLVSARNAWDHDLLLERTHIKKGRWKKKCLHFESLAAKASLLIHYI